jgi:hypothetical protein
MQRFKFPHPLPHDDHRESISQVPQAYILWPIVCQVPFESPFMVWQRQLYEQALREAQAVVRPSILERNLFWN